MYKKNHTPSYDFKTFLSLKDNYKYTALSPSEAYIYYIYIFILIIFHRFLLHGIKSEQKKVTSTW